MYLIFLSLFYILLSVAGIFLLYRYLKPRLKDEVSVWMFSISLSLSITFLLLLLVLYFFFDNIFTNFY